MVSSVLSFCVINLTLSLLPPPPSSGKLIIAKVFLGHSTQAHEMDTVSPANYPEISAVFRPCRQCQNAAHTASSGTLAQLEKPKRELPSSAGALSSTHLRVSSRKCLPWKQNTRISVSTYTVLPNVVPMGAVVPAKAFLALLPLVVAPLRIHGYGPKHRSIAPNRDHTISFPPALFMLLLPLLHHRVPEASHPSQPHVLQIWACPPYP